MGLRPIITSLLGSGGAQAATTLVEAIRGNVENAAQRGADFDVAALQQFAAEFANPRESAFDRIVNGLNRLPRPLIVLGVLALLIMPVARPSLAAEVFTAWAIIPNPVWVIVTVVITFFFGGRMQVADLNFTRELTAAATALPGIIQQVEALREFTSDTPRVADTGADAEVTIEVVQPDLNPALEAALIAEDLR